VRAGASAVACAAVLAVVAGVHAPLAAGAPPKVGLVTEVGGLKDHGFNQLAAAGLHRAATKLGAATALRVSRSTADYVPYLSSLARQGYGLVIGVGSPMRDAIRLVARKFPHTRFMIVDDAWSKGDPKNLEGTRFAEEQAGYLAGYLAGLLYAGKAVTLSTVGGEKIPAVDRYIAGFQAGAKASDPQATLLNGYAQSFIARSKCKELAMQQIARGAKVVFPVAGSCGLGSLAAAKQKHVWGIGADADLAYLGPQILTSALKRVDTAVFTTIEQLGRGHFEAARTFTFAVANDGIDLGAISPDVPKAVVAKVEAMKAILRSHPFPIRDTVP
jgi:basic membrane protein A and related proteins